MVNAEAKTIAVCEENMRHLIHSIRDTEVMTDSDLAKLYCVETKVFNQAIKRNINRFPQSFRFQLTHDEYDTIISKSLNTDPVKILRSQSVTSREHGGRRYLPYVFTEQGVAMLSSVLRSETAIQTSIQIINAFVAMRRFFLANEGLFQRIDFLEKRLAIHEIKTQEGFDKVFDALGSKSQNNTQGIFFDGQIFDAYIFINDLLRQAKKSIILFDNYIDDSTLQQLAKRRNGVEALLFTRTISAMLIQDLKKHNAQYASINVYEFSNCHDRFLIIDGETVFHLGASLKDLGKKWFAFSKMEKSGLKVMEKVNEIMQMSTYA